MRACFLFPFQNEYTTKMQVHAKADCFWLILPPFSGWLQKFRNTDIVSLASPRGILEPPSAGIFCMPEPLPNVGVLLACFLTDAQISNS